MNHPQRSIDETRVYRLTTEMRRTAMYWANVNGLLWGIGNGLASSSLIIYLALEFNAPQIGLGIGMLLAAPHFVGSLRMFTPLLIDHIADRKQFCLRTFFISAWFLLGIPLFAVPSQLGASDVSVLLSLVLIWCLFHLYQYLGTIALFAWIADLVPVQVRGRFLGGRQSLILIGQISAMLSATLFGYYWNLGSPAATKWVQYAILSTVGSLVMISALVPLIQMPHIAHRIDASQLHQISWSFLIVPFQNFEFRKLLLFGCWFSAVNGITQAAQGYYPAKVLGLSLYMMLILRIGMQSGQVALGPTLGKLADRIGNVPVMIGCQLLVALGPLFYYLSTPDQPYWIVVAWIVWMFYAGLNICLPNLLLKLPGEENRTPYLSIYYTCSSLCYALSTLLGGYLLDKALANSISNSFSDPHFGSLSGEFAIYLSAMFLGGWLLRSLSVGLLFWIREN